jgi:hypothetical protein
MRATPQFLKPPISRVAIVAFAARAVAAINASNFDRLAGDAPGEHDFRVVRCRAARERQDPALKLLSKNGVGR